MSEAGLLSFKEQRLSAVNASAILHEVSSYGVLNHEGGKSYGAEAVKQTIYDIRRCLADGGVLVYRDIACPNDRLALKTVPYERKSWQIFLKIYLPILHEVSQEICPEILKGYKLNNSETNSEITATAQLQREIQRHYITFRDYVRKKIFPKIGIAVIRERWNNKDSGNKTHSLELSTFAIRQYLPFKSIEHFDKNIKILSVEMQSDEYDDFTDKIIEDFLSKDSFDVYDEWFRREGREIYTYLNLSELKALTEKKQSLMNVSNNKMVASNERLLPRNYYQRYLNRVIANPEYEGKQAANFIKKHDQ